MRLEHEAGELRANDPAGDPLIGLTLNDRYRIVAPIGVGGMGKVYKAVQMPLERAVALKVLDPAYARSSDPNFLRRFMREASLTSQLRHPNTVTIIDYGQTGDIYYIAMEYLEGQTLSKLLTKQGPLAWPRALEIAQQICRSLREAHNLGVVHRDLKPANVMVISEADTDLVKVLDFGLVKSVGSNDETPRGMRFDASPTPPERQDPDSPTPPINMLPVSPEITQHGIFLGSPTYMSPEQAKNRSDLRSDIYSLGVVLYQMLMGRPPFVSKDHIELIFAHHREPPTPFTVARPDIHVPPEVEAMVLKCLKKRPEARYQTMDEVLEAMRVAAVSAGLSGTFPRSTTSTFRIHSTPLPPPQQVPAEPSIALDITLDEATIHGPPRESGRLVPLVVLLSTLLLVTGGALLNQWLKAPVPNPSPMVALPQLAAPPPPPVAKPEPEKKSAPVERAPAPPRVARFQVSSEPEGAEVTWKGELMGVTPATFEIPLGREGSVTAELTFQLDGYQPETVIAGGSGEVVLMQKLRRLELRAAPRTRAVAGHAATGPGEEVTEADDDGPEPPEVLGTDSIPLPAPEAAERPKVVTAPRMPVTVLPFGEGMSRPVQLEGEEIEYTREALDAKAEGDMLVRCVITTQGRVEDCLIIKGIATMNEAVLKALSTRRYTPVMFQGRPVAVTYIFPFKLRHPGR